MIILSSFYLLFKSICMALTELAVLIFELQVNGLQAVGIHDLR